MRSGAVRAALALAALALAAGGCSDLVSSLTPFGVGDRKPDRNEVAYSGVWDGATSSGGDVLFQVAGGLVGPLLLQHVSGTCTLTFGTAEDATAPIDDGRFTFELEIDPQGRIVIEGTFVTTETLSGSYAFDGRASTTGCPTSGSGSFTATKLRQP
jgi:hypothetical protein